MTDQHIPRIIMEEEVLDPEELAQAQARLLTKAVAEDADLQSRISRVLNSEQRKKLDRLKQSNEVSGLQVVTAAR